MIDSGKKRRPVRELAVEVDSGRVVLRGRATSYHVKQLAQHGVRDILPDAPLENAICITRNRAATEALS